jgi:hypothetical protein
MPKSPATGLGNPGFSHFSDFATPGAAYLLGREEVLGWVIQVSACPRDLRFDRSIRFQTPSIRCFQVGISVVYKFDEVSKRIGRQGGGCTSLTSSLIRFRRIAVSTQQFSRPVPYAHAPIRDWGTTGRSLDCAWNKSSGECLHA